MTIHGPDQVKSGAIRTVEYDTESKDLNIVFTDGTPARYMGVPEQEYWNLMNAPSVGYYFNTNIRDHYSMGG